MKVYVATSGSYSDYTVLGVFSTRELANEAGDNDAIECVVYDRMPKRRTSYYLLGFIPDSPGYGTDGKVERHTFYPWDFEGTLYPATARPTVSVVANAMGVICIRVSGANKEAVQKAYADRRGQIIAGLEGIA